MGASRTAAADAAPTDPPATLADTPQPAAEAAPPAEDRGPGVYEFVGETAHTFLPQGFPPQTAGPGDVCDLPWSPGPDPRWQPTTKPVTRRPDNDPASGAPAVHDGVTDVAHTEAEREAILARLGIDPNAVKEN